ncbi:hypothetical protein HDU81_001399 [Chytriomyces hyalinus]|nr:hypothetical protein HDU81_001399 [Chytriomyces hyalinus]
MDKSLDELITESRRSRARGGTADGIGFMSARKERERGGRRERRRTPYEHNDNRQRGDGSDLRKSIGKGKGKQGEWVGYPLALENLHFNVMPNDITAFISQTDDKVTIAIDYDEAGRSLGTAKIYFATSEAAAEGQKALHGMSLLGSIISAEIVPVEDRAMHDMDNDVVDSNSDAYGNGNGEYAYKSILDRMGSKRPSAYAAGNGSVLDRLGSRVLDRLGPTVIYNQSGRSHDGRSRQNGGSRGERSNNSGRSGRARPVKPEDLDKEMDSYMSGDGNPVVLEEVDNGSWKSGNYNYEDRVDVRKEFVDFDAPSNDPYTTVGGGSGGGRGLLDYGDL